MIIADTNGLLAAFVQSDPEHRAVVQALEGAGAPLVISPYVLAELDYLLATRVGVSAAITVMRELAGGAYVHPELDETDISASVAVVEQYRDQNIGLADASLVVLAARYRTHTILTLDHRHFDVLRQLDGGRFDLLPGAGGEQ